MAEKLGVKWRRTITIITIVALVLLVFVSRHQILDTINNLGKVQASLLLLLILWKFMANHGYTRLYMGLFNILGRKMRYWPMLKVTLEMNFVNTVFPSGGVSGFTYWGLRLGEFGVSGGKATLVQMMKFVTTFVSFLGLIFLGILTLAVVDKASNLTIMIASSMATLVLVMTLLLAFIVGSKRRIDSFFTMLTRSLNKILHTVRPGHPETINVSSARKMFLDMHQNYLVLKKEYRRLGPPMWHATVANVGELLTLYTVFLAFGHVINPGSIIIAYAIANIAGLISVLPGGIGIYEGLMVTVLITAGVPPSVSIPAIVMYRILAIGIQIPIGYYFYSKALNGHGKPANS